MTKGPLEGLRVLLIGQVWLGPMCGALFSDSGAEVIRLESHNHIDAYRPLFTEGGKNIEGGPYYQVLNRNALSVTLNMKQPRARELAKEIIKISDVLLENNAPPILKKWGLDYPSVCAINPRIIMASMSGFGQTGPLWAESGYGPVTTALSGLARMVGYENEEPVGLLTAIADPISGVSAFVATMAALHHRSRTGKGQYIDVSQLEVVATLMGSEVLDYTMNDRNAPCVGNSSTWLAPHGCYRCKGDDRWITIACRTQEEWEEFCRGTGNEHWLQDERFVDNYARLTNRKALDETIGEWTCNHSDYEVMEMLQRAGVAALPVFTIADLFTDTHAVEEEYLVHLPHPEQPCGYVYNIPWKLSETPGGVRRHAPLLGEHNEYVLCDLCGLSKEEFTSLVEEKVIW